ncbi:MAG: MFS transporter [Chitinophagales bacterium]|nr:MFS transporter [Chitinophagales bacterium]
MSAHIKWFLSFRFFTTIALQMKMTILGFFIYKISGAALALGMLGLYEALPRILLALPAGYQVERMEKRKVLTIVVGSYFIIALAMYFAMTFLQGQNSKLEIILYLGVFLMGVVGSMGMGASVALLSSIIPRSEMAKYSAMSSNAWQIGAVVGPILGGYLIKYAGSENAFIFVVIALFISLLSILKLPRHESQFNYKFSFQDSFHKMKEGLTYVFENKVMLWAISLDLFAVLFGGCVALLPIFATDILKVDSEGFGHLRAAMPLGAAITMLFLARKPIRQHTGKWLIIFVGLFGLATLGFALSTSFYISLVLLFLMGAFDAVSVVIRGAILMLETPDHMRARVTSVNSMFISSSNEIGAFESGFAAQIMGTVRSVLFGGSMTLLFVTIAWNKAKALKDYSMK